ncbi:hypothetical protein U9M48_015027, partial [Paspalum notatum var. saurae]
MQYWSNIKCHGNNGRSSWKNAWKNAGKCSGLEEEDYFETALRLNPLVRLQAGGIQPDFGLYSVKVIKRVFQTAIKAAPAIDPTVVCPFAPPVAAAAPSQATTASACGNGKSDSDAAIKVDETESYGGTGGTTQMADTDSYGDTGASGGQAELLITCISNVLHRSPARELVEDRKSAWNSYGVCSGLKQLDYFKAALNLRKQADVLGALAAQGINPDYKLYNTEKIKWAGRAFGKKQLYQVYLCVDTDAKTFIECPKMPKLSCPDAVVFHPFYTWMLNATAAVAADTKILLPTQTALNESIAGGSIPSSAAPCVRPAAGRRAAGAGGIQYSRIRDHPDEVLCCQTAARAESTAPVAL